MKNLLLIITCSLIISEAIATGTSDRLRVHVHGGERRGGTLQVSLGSPGGLVVARERFDQLLIDRAAEVGVDVMQPAAARIAGLDDGGAAVEVRTGSGAARHLCRLVVGADGVDSAVARAAGVPRKARVGRKYGFAVPTAGPVDQTEQKRTGHRPVKHIPFLIDFQIDEGLQGAIIIQEVHLGRPFCELIEGEFVESYHSHYR